MFNLNRTIVRGYMRRQNTRKRMTAVTARVHNYGAADAVSAKSSAEHKFAPPSNGSGSGSVYAAAVPSVASASTASALTAATAAAAVDPKSSAVSSASAYKAESWCRGVFASNCSPTTPMDLGGGRLVLPGVEFVCDPKTVYTSPKTPAGGNCGRGVTHVKAGVRVQVITADSPLEGPAVVKSPAFGDYWENKRTAKRWLTIAQRHNTWGDDVGPWAFVAITYHPPNEVAVVRKGVNGFADSYIRKCAEFETKFLLGDKYTPFVFMRHKDNASAAIIVHMISAQADEIIGFDEKLTRDLYAFVLKAKMHKDDAIREFASASSYCDEQPSPELPAPMSDDSNGSP